MNNKLDNLIKNYGKRKKPNADVLQNAQANIRAHWLQTTKKHKLQKHRVLITRLAASLFIVLTVGFFMLNNRVISAPMANVKFVQGDIQISSDKKLWHPLLSGQLINKGNWLKTSTTGLANLALNDNSQLRINSNTLLQFQKKSEIELFNGEIYNDADSVNDAPKLLIKTKIANIQHIGTRYAVKFEENKLQVMVRNGQVLLESGIHHEKINQQQHLTVLDNGQITKSNITTYDPAWQWTKSANTPYELDGKTLNDFVSWYAYENGYQIDWNGLRFKSENVKLSGNIEDMASDKLFKIVLLSTLYGYEINSGVLKILKPI